MLDTLGEVAKSLFERLNNPFIFSFCVSFFFVHFDAIMYLFLSEAVADERLRTFYVRLGLMSVNGDMANVMVPLFWPLFLATFYTLGWPFFNGAIMIARGWQENQIRRGMKRIVKSAYFTSEEMELAEEKLGLEKQKNKQFQSELDYSSSRLADSEDELMRLRNKAEENAVDAIKAEKELRDREETIKRLEKELAIVEQEPIPFLELDLLEDAQEALNGVFGRGKEIMKRYDLVSEALVGLLAMYDSKVTYLQLKLDHYMRDFRDQYSDQARNDLIAKIKDESDIFDRRNGIRPLYGLNRLKELNIGSFDSEIFKEVDKLLNEGSPRFHKPSEKEIFLVAKNIDAEISKIRKLSDVESSRASKDST